MNYLPNRVSFLSDNSPPPRNPKLQLCLEDYVSEQIAASSVVTDGIAAAKGLDLSALPDDLAGDVSKTGSSCGRGGPRGARRAARGRRRRSKPRPGSTVRRLVVVRDPGEEDPQACRRRSTKLSTRMNRMDEGAGARSAGRSTIEELEAERAALEAADAGRLGRGPQHLCRADPGRGQGPHHLSARRRRQPTKVPAEVLAVLAVGRGLRCARGRRWPTSAASSRPGPATRRSTRSRRSNRPSARSKVRAT